MADSEETRPRKTRRRQRVEETIRAGDPWEPVGQTPMPGIPDLRNWDMRLMRTYSPVYAPPCDICFLCTYGKCDLTAGRRGACGIGMAGQQGRTTLLAVCMGLSAHGAYARRVIEHLIEQHGDGLRIDLGSSVAVEAPNIRLVMGVKPETLADLVTALEYVEGELVHLVSSLHTGQEASPLDFESKALHAGMLDHVAMEAADIAQIVGFKFPSSVADTPLVDLGCSTLDADKPAIVVVGHSPLASTAIIDYLRRNGLRDSVEVGGLCSTALDTSRYDEQARVIGPLSRQLFYIRTGIADMVVADELCVRTDLPDEARKAGSGFIATSDKACYGLEDATDKDSDRIVREMLEEGRQFLILDPGKAGEVAVRVAQALAPQRKSQLLSVARAQELAGKCVQCDICERVCPNLLDVGAAMGQAAGGDMGPMTEVFDRCLGCGKCQEECPYGVPVLQIMQAAARTDAYRMRAGRGPIMDTEIRNAGAPIVLGTVPGVVAFVGCSNYPDMNDLAEMAEEFARRKYVVLLSGCAAMAVGMKKDAEGRSIYERYPPAFVPGGVINLGSCVSSAHITGAAIKIANIFATLPLRGNYEVIADYILNRVGAVGVGWGATSQMAVSLATGCNRLGVPVVLGPHSAKYGRMFLSGKEAGDWSVRDGRRDEMVDTGEPSPEHLAYVTETRERAMITIAKLCIRKNDTPQGRAVKLNHYIALYRNHMGGGLPPDLHLYVRTDKDLPIVYKKEATAYLKDVGWEPKPVLTLPTLIGTYPSKVPPDAVIR